MDLCKDLWDIKLATALEEMTNMDNQIHELRE